MRCRNDRPRRQVNQSATPQTGKETFMTLEYFNVGRANPVALDLDDSDKRLRLLELESWSQFIQKGFARLVDSASASYLLAPDDVRQLVAAVRAKQTVLVTVSQRQPHA
jgi:hypothetical protein